jgi:hypothetical protein
MLHYVTLHYITLRLVGLEKYSATFLVGGTPEFMKDP